MAALLLPRAMERGSARGQEGVLPPPLPNAVRLACCEASRGPDLRVEREAVVPALLALQAPPRQGENTEGCEPPLPGQQSPHGLPRQWRGSDRGHHVSLSPDLPVRFTAKSDPGQLTDTLGSERQWRMVARCIQEGLVSGQRMAVDVSLIEADANKRNSTPKDARDVSRIGPTDAPRAVREHLDTLDETAFGQPDIAVSRNSVGPVPQATLLPVHGLPIHRTPRA